MLSVRLRSIPMGRTKARRVPTTSPNTASPKDPDIWALRMPSGRTLFAFGLFIYAGTKPKQVVDLQAYRP
jgi:hypothetical protein